MEKSLAFPLIILILSLLSSATHCTAARTPAHATATLDVAASLKRANNVISSEKIATAEASSLLSSSNSRPDPESEPASTGKFTLELHPRAAIQTTPEEDYGVLSSSRINRDKARVDAIVSTVNLALSGLNKSLLQPQFESGFTARPDGLNAPVTSGTSRGSGEYFARVAFGSPPKSMLLVPDTGSDVNWIQCEPCSSCYTQSDTVFDPKTSTTFSPLTCNTPQCNALDTSQCDNSMCKYEVNYGDGSFTIGELATETLSFGAPGSSVPHIAFGCGHNNQGLFVGSDGLAGLGGGPLSLTSQLKAKTFSYCFVDRDSSGSSTLEFDSPLPKNSVMAPLIRSPKALPYFYVGLTGISVGGQNLPFPPSVFEMNADGAGGVIVDSGTSVTRLPQNVYNALRDSFRSMTQHLPRTEEGFAIFDTCYDMSGRTSATVPKVAFTFGAGQRLELPPKNFIVPVNSMGTFCLAFATTPTAMGIIGNVQQQGIRVSYDLANMRLGFAPNQC